MPDSGGKVIDILLVDDNPGDVRLVQEVLKDAKIANQMNVVEDGVEALAFLRKEGRYATEKQPDLILLDLNLPRKDGHAVLAEIKADPELKLIPVVILTSSEAEQDIIAAYHEQASCYITKPVNLDQFVRVVRTFEDFWLAIVKLPPKSR